MSFYPKPPIVSPNYHARVFGAGTFHFSPFPNGIDYSFEPEIIYNQTCWNTNYQCTTPTYRITKYIPIWPGPNDWYEYKLKLLNLGKGRVKFNDYILRQSEDYFEVVLPNHLPQIVECGESYSFVIRYKPGYYRLTGYTPGHYTARANLSTLVTYIDFNDVETAGPDIIIELTINQSGT